MHQVALLLFVCLISLLPAPKFLSANEVPQERPQQVAEVIKPVSTDTKNTPKVKKDKKHKQILLMQ
jgi:hypothetical protein